MASEFDRLPTELIISIFERILDARCLFICYSVCKRFAALVLQTRFVSVRIRSVIGTLSAVPVWPPGILNFLKKLGCVESATIQFSLCNPNPPSRSEPLFRWKSDSSGFIILFYENFVDDSACDSDDEYPSHEYPLFEKNSALFGWMEDQLSDSGLRILYIEELIPVFPNLKNVLAVDSMGQGRVVLDEEGISKMKEKRIRPFWVRRWSAPLVKSSFSECVMKEVTLIAVVEAKDCEEDDDDDWFEIKDCDRFMEEDWFEEKEYCEVATTMMKKYKCPKTFISDPSRLPLPHAAIWALYHEKSERACGDLYLTGYSFQRNRRYKLKIEYGRLYVEVY